MNTQDVRLADALHNEPQYIAQLMQMPDSILTKKLNTIRQQMEMAYQKQLTTALETLSIWERQIIEARYLKNDFEDSLFWKLNQENIHLKVLPIDEFINYFENIVDYIFVVNLKNDWLLPDRKIDRGY